MNKTLIDRINELYHKSKNEGLNEEEKNEQACLRSEYIKAVKDNMRAQLEKIDIVNEDGSVTVLSDMHSDTN